MSMTRMFVVPYTYGQRVSRKGHVYDIVDVPLAYCRPPHHQLEGASSRTRQYLEGRLNRPSNAIVIVDSRHVVVMCSFRKPDRRYECM